jgi:putative nucleotidyltransferase with HDIG domain
MRLGKALYTSRGEVLLARGVELTDEYVGRIRERGFHFVYVMDGIADDVEPMGLISDRLRSAAVNNIQVMYDLMAEASQAVRDQVAAAGAHVLREVPLAIGPAVGRRLERLDQDVEALLEETLETRTLGGIASLKSYDNYTFEHSVDVAFYGVALGRRLSLDRTYLRDLALGCLLHDIGKMYVDERILNKPGKLDPDEFEQIKQHTVLGFHMLRQTPISSAYPAHVALQHHERQDGGGYPRGLFGTNKIFRTDRERFDPYRIHLLAELAAVADVCSALASDRPYRAALPPTVVVRALRQFAGHHLNAEALNAFLSMAPSYPVGMHVRVQGGRYDGCYGVVTRVRPATPDRPDVRLLVDRWGRPLPADCEIRLAQQPDSVELVAVPESGLSVEEYARRVALAA